MKSSTIRRSTLSRESMDVYENLAREQQYEGSTLGEYYRPEEINDSQSYESASKSKEIDLLWQNFKTTQFSSNSPVANIFIGFISGVLCTLFIMACFGVFSKSPAPSMAPIVESTVSEQIEDSQSEVSNKVSIPGEDDFVQPVEQVSQTTQADNSNDTSKMTKYIVKNGDTGEAIIKRHYGVWSQEKLDAIIRVNNLKNLDRLQIDQVLYLP